MATSPSSWNLAEEDEDVSSTTSVETPQVETYNCLHQCDSRYLQPITAARPALRLWGPRGSSFLKYEEVTKFEARGGQETERVDDELYLENSLDLVPRGAQETISAPNTLANDRTAVELKDMQGGALTENIFAYTMGAYHIQVWDDIPWVQPGEGDGQGPAHSRVRRPVDGTVMVDALTRACEATCRVSDEKNRHKVETRLGISDNTPTTLQSNIRQVYVGISALDYMPVFMTPDKEYKVKLELGLEHTRWEEDNMISVKLKTEPSRELIGQSIIWSQAMLVPGNIAHVKQGLWATLSPDGQIDFISKAMREHRQVIAGLKAVGVAKVYPCGLGYREVPRFRSFHHGTQYHTLPFRLMWPPIAVLEFPPEMIDAVKEFLKAYPRDIIPLNLALAAIIIYFDLENDHWKAEGFISGGYKDNPPPVTLEMFVLYFPHMLRFVEVKQLSAYIHPGRFAFDNFQADFMRSQKDFGFRGYFNVPKMRDWAVGITSRCPEIPADQRMELIPASMPGTSMVFPLGHPDAFKHSRRTFALGLLDDIRTIGLPSYHRYPSHCQSFGVPAQIARPRISASGTQISTIRGIPNRDYWLPGMSSTRELALTGPAKFVGPVFQDVEPTQIASGTGDLVVKKFGRWVPKLPTHFLFTVMPAVDRSKHALVTKQLHRVARHLNVDPEKMDIDLENLLPRWEGMDSDLERLQRENKLKRLVAEPAPEPAPEPATFKRARLMEPQSGTESTPTEAQGTPLDDRVKDRLAQAILDVKVRSLDWKHLHRYLMYGSGQTVEGARKQLEPVVELMEQFELILEHDNIGGALTSSDVIRLMFRASGLVEPPRAETFDYVQGWESKLKRFPEETWNAMEFIYRNRNVDSYFWDLNTAMAALRYSDLVTDQIILYQDVRAALEMDELSD
ncbi:hypothetical protein FDECE_12035 [Fusarium decemcellulare]|nr:hypothetical protein FDECE_12035 [Fusarium decemcellulare]